MSGAILLLVGAVLCFVGAKSLRLAVFASGFGAAWLLADALGAPVSTTAVVALAGGVGAFVVTLVMSHIVSFVAGCVVGAAIGAKLFAILEGNDTSWLLALVFVPAVAIAFGVGASRFQRRFLIVATAFGGAALMLSGLAGVSDGLELFDKPDDPTESVILTVVWVGLGIAGRAVQLRIIHDD